MTKENNENQEIETNSEPTVSIVKVKRASHPNEGKYQGRMTYDHNFALITMSQNMTPEQMERFGEPNGIVDLERLNKFLNEVQVGDIIGVDTELYSVEGKTTDGLLCKNDLFLKNKEIDTALGMGFCEILYRDKKPYGVSETVNVKILDYSQKKEKK